MRESERVTENRETERVCGLAREKGDRNSQTHSTVRQTGAQANADTHCTYMRRAYTLTHRQDGPAINKAVQHGRAHL